MISIFSKSLNTLPQIPLSEPPECISSVLIRGAKSLLLNVNRYFVEIETARAIPRSEESGKDSRTLPLENPKQSHSDARGH